MSGHTPVPWHRSGFRIKGPNGEFIGVSCADPEAVGLANADYIVCAVNSHEELLEAAKALVEDLDPTDHFVMGLAPVVRLQAVVEKAEGNK